MLHLNTPPFSLRGMVLVSTIWMMCNAQALQIGQPTLQSQLGQPLKLEVQISDLNALEAQDFQASLADDSVYQTAKINRVTGLDNVTITLNKRGEDVYVLQMLGTEPLVSPYVDLLMEFRWATGRSYRNIGFPLSGTLINTAAAAPSPERATNEETPKTATSTTDTIEIQRGDTASALVMATADSSDVSLDQLLIAMLRNNPKAFVNNNVNRLKAGALVTLPTPEEASQISRQEARQNIRLQAQDFDAYRAQLAGAAPNTKLADASQREATGNLKAQLKNNGKTAADQLTLSKPGASDADKVSKQLEDEQTTKRNEELAKNASELNTISKVAANLEEGLGTNFNDLEAQYESAMVWIKRHAFELIGALAVLAAALVTFSLLRERRQSEHSSDKDNADDLGFMPETFEKSSQELNIDFDLELPHHPTPASVSPDVSTASIGSSTPVAMHDTPVAEDPYKVRLELADELWKLGQKQTGRALAQEVADQTHGEIRDRAMRWLTERA